MTEPAIVLYALTFCVMRHQPTFLGPDERLFPGCSRTVVEGLKERRCERERIRFTHQMPGITFHCRRQER
jgi:hypothetical protein